MEKLILREYQERIIDNIEGHFAFDNYCVVTLPPGGGKSAIASKLSDDYSEEGIVVVLTNFSALIPQLSNHLEMMGIPHNIIKAGMHKTEKDAKVYLIMEQSFHEKERAKHNFKTSLLIKDEIHVGKGMKRYEDIVSFLEPQKTVGLTATPLSEKGYIMHGTRVDQLIMTIGIKELTAQGYLSPIKYFVPKFAQDMDYSSVKMSGSDYSSRDLEGILNTNKNIDLTIKAMNQRNAINRKVLIYANSIEHAEDINRALKDNGYKTAIVHSKMDKQESDKAIALFRGEKRSESLLEEEEVNTLVSVMSLAIGFDAPVADLLVMLRPTKILRLWLQIGMRVGRPHKSKEFSEVLDLAQCVQNLGFLDEPIPLIEEGEKEKLKSAMKEREKNVIGLIVNEEPTEITEELIIEKVEEIRRKSEHIPDIDNDSLIAIYETSVDPEKIIEIGYEINRRKTGQTYTQNSVKWSSKTWVQLIDDFPEYEMRILRSLKTMMRNKVAKGAKCSGIHYSPEWLREQEPYCYKQLIEQNIKEEPTTNNYGLPPEIVIDEDDIPF